MVTRLAPTERGVSSRILEEIPLVTHRLDEFLPRAFCGTGLPFLLFFFSLRQGVFWYFCGADGK